MLCVNSAYIFLINGEISRGGSSHGELAFGLKRHADRARVGVVFSVVREFGGNCHVDFSRILVGFEIVDATVVRPVCHVECTVEMVFVCRRDGDGVAVVVGNLEESLVAVCRLLCEGYPVGNLFAF